jgi:uncharacterized protein YndB with AHSA1/START domain
MSTTSRNTTVDPEAIWAVLADAESYSRWVLGLTRIVSADSAWPAPGSTIRYVFRYGPFALRGDATVLDAHPPRHLRIRWKRSWRMYATAEFLIEPPAAPGSDRGVLRLRQELVGLFAGRSANPFAGGLSAANAVTSLARLERLALERASRRPEAGG